MSEVKETIFTVKGMGCTSCVSHVQEALGTIEGVARIEVDVREGKVRVQHDPAKVSTERVIEALAQAGYESSGERAK
jgi:copper ion binding protein